MKSFLLACVAVLFTCTLSMAQIPSSAQPDSMGKATVHTSYQTAQDTTFNIPDDDAEDDAKESATYFDDSDDDTFDSNFSIPFFTQTYLVEVIAIIFFFGSPIAILFLIFYFRYKNRQARYRLMQQALEKGQPLPKELFKDGNHSPAPNPQQGIRNTFLGIGLFIFLWAVTGEFGIGSIGLLVAFIGLGQWVSDSIQLKQKAKECTQQDNKEFQEKSDTDQ